MKTFCLRFQETVSFIIFFFLFALLNENTACGQPKERDYWPTDEWQFSTPEMQGMDPAKLAIAERFIQERLPDAFSLLVVRNGYLVCEKYYSYGSPHKYAVVHSVTKSVTSALIGIALEKGYLHSLDQKMIEFFPEYNTDDLDPKKKGINLKHLLTMSAGLKWNDWGPDMANWYLSSDWANHTIQLPLEHNPGDIFNYNTSTSHLLSIILSKSTNTDTFDFAKQNLFQPLGIQSAYWHQDPQGYYIGGFGLGLTVRDLAKIGFLYLNNGYWDGRSIVPEHWVKESTTQQIQAQRNPLYGAFGYGYQWWVKEIDGCSSYRAWGRRGQYIVVVPDLDLVIAVTSNPEQPHPPTSIHYSPLFDLVAASVQRKRPLKEPLESVYLPADVKAFITDYNIARNNKDVIKMGEAISDGFLHNGVTKQMAISFLSETSSYISDAEIVVTKFKLSADKAILDVWLKDKYFEAPFMMDSKLIKENGRWKWYGNQM